jgi:pyruvate dehydrogenase E2 component (dihydrolipoamide acetyltransferase)
LAEVRPTLLASATEPEQFLAEVQVKTTNVAEVLDGEASATLSPTPAGTSGRVTNVVPLARKLAAQKGIDLRTITGTGTSGRIVVRDVQAAIELASTPQPVDSPPVADNGKGPSSPSVAPSLAEGEREQKLSPMRRIIADRMMSSLRETAQLTLTSTADVTDFAQLRASVGGGARKPGYVEAVVRACALSLREHPSLNARLNENAIVSSDSVNIGVAVAVEGGLVVPVIHNADRLGLADTGERVVEIAEAARSGRLSPDDYAGGTFSVTSLGAQGIDAFTPILNQPESGILGIGRSREVAVRFGKGIAWRHEITLSLTIDHRVIDGYPAALFLQEVVRRLENPRILL